MAARRVVRPDRFPRSLSSSRNRLVSQDLRIAERGNDSLGIVEPGVRRIGFRQVENASPRPPVAQPMLD